MTGIFARWLQHQIMERPISMKGREALRQEWSHGASTLGRLFVQHHQHEIGLWTCSICRITFYGQPLYYLRSGAAMCSCCHGEPALRPANGGAM